MGLLGRIPKLNDLRFPGLGFPRGSLALCLGALACVFPTQAWLFGIRISTLVVDLNASLVWLLSIYVCGLPCSIKILRHFTK